MRCTNHSTPVPLVTASLLAAPWHQPAAGCRGDKPPKQKFKSYPIGYFHVDIAEVQTAEGKLSLFVAIDRTSKFALQNCMRRLASGRAQFLRNSSLPFPMLSIPCSRITASSSQTRTDTYAFIPHLRPRLCEHGIEHRLTRSSIPGQTVRSNA